MLQCFWDCPRSASASETTFIRERNCHAPCHVIILGYVHLGRCVIVHSSMFDGIPALQAVLLPVCSLEPGRKFVLVFCDGVSWVGSGKAHVTCQLLRALAGGNAGVSWGQCSIVPS